MNDSYIFKYFECLVLKLSNELNKKYIDIIIDINDLISFT